MQFNDRLSAAPSSLFRFSAIRLEYIHAKASQDRWIEELHLLEENLRRLAPAYDKEAKRLEQLSREADGSEWSRQEIKGYKAWCWLQEQMWLEESEQARKAYNKARSGRKGGGGGA